MRLKWLHYCHVGACGGGGCVLSDALPLEQHQEKRFLSRGFLPGQWTAQNCLAWTSAKPAVCPQRL